MDLRCVSGSNVGTQGGFKVGKNYNIFGENMSQLTIYLNKNTLQKLKKLSDDSGKSVSKISSEIIEKAINLQQEQQNDSENLYNKKMSEFKKKQYATLVATFNLANECFKKLNNEPSKYDGKKADDIMNDAGEAAIKTLKDL